MKLSEKNLVQYVANNPGLTAAMIGKLTRRRYGSVSSALCLLAQAGKIGRMELHGERGGRTKAWRYFPNKARQRSARAFASKNEALRWKAQFL